ncbi:D-Ala-D-Ala carboxypeptidase family metallohydrolase [uncultured Bacteroides sp.]|uniref:D-Ala-D-Ala carboxypeptidase family metallohydrolase n=1 Tax=uncultured Bacteroides sp. TaxID=162156 RepID=UPI0025E7FD73|nr:D-Ala-D-Ala carboxypeptidase family metallohydrolase [uncultured Bacteroides sp.]
MKYFTITELCRSRTADRLGIANRCGSEYAANLVALVDNVLDPLREWYGKPVRVSSGYRCPELNAVVKGSAVSQHLIGQAADIDTGDRGQNKLLFEYIRKHLPFDQLIDESNFAWVHVSYRADGKNRKQVLKL